MAQALSPTAFEQADTYRSGERVQSKMTHRIGTVIDWPVGQAYPPGHGPVHGTVMIRWDNNPITPTHAWRHQIHRI